jgi:hypothetical protein
MVFVSLAVVHPFHPLVFIGLSSIIHFNYAKLFNRRFHFLRISPDDHYFFNPGITVEFKSIAFILAPIRIVFTVAIFQQRGIQARSA